MRKGQPSGYKVIYREDGVRKEKVFNFAIKWSCKAGFHMTKEQHAEVIMFIKQPDIEYLMGVYTD